MTFAVMAQKKRLIQVEWDKCIRESTVQGEPTATLPALQHEGQVLKPSLKLA